MLQLAPNKKKKVTIHTSTKIVTCEVSTGSRKIEQKTLQPRLMKLSPELEFSISLRLLLSESFFTDDTIGTAVFIANPSD